MTSCEKGRLPPIEEDGLASQKDQEHQRQHSITSLQQDSTHRPRNNVLSPDRKSTSQKAMKGLEKFLARESQAPIFLMGEPTYHPFTSSYAYRETRFEARPSSLGQSPTTWQNNGREGQENWNTGVPCFGGDFKGQCKRENCGDYFQEKTQFLAQDFSTINFDQVKQGLAGPHSNDMETLRDVHSNQADFENTRCPSTIERGSLSTELEALQPGTCAWIEKRFGAAADQKPIFPSKNCSFLYSPSCHSEWRIEAGPSRIFSTLNTDPPLSYTREPLKINSVPHSASGTKDRQASALVQAGSGEKSKDKCRSKDGHEEVTIIKNASNTTSDDNRRTPIFLLQCPTGQQYANKELDLKSRSDEVEEENILQEKKTPLALQEDEASAERKLDEMDEFSRLLANELFGGSAQDNCKVIRQKSLPRDAVIQLQNEVQGQQGNLLAIHPDPPHKFGKDVKKAVKLQTVPLAEDPLLQIDKECTTQLQNDFDMINEERESAKRPEPALDEGRNLESVENRSVDDRVAQNSISLDSRGPRWLSRHEVPESTLRGRMVARTSRSWGLRRFLQYRAAPNSLQQSKADSKRLVKNSPSKKTYSSRDRALALQFKPEKEKLTARKEQTWYDKARAFRDIARVGNSNDETKLAREQAKTAKREEKHQKQEKKAQEAAAAKAEKSRQRRLRECAVCTDRFEKPQLIRPCDHYYCPECLAECFRRALIAQPKQIFRCCKRVIPVALAAQQLGPSAVRKYELLALELSMKNPLYCSSAPCNAFIPPDSIHGDAGTCLSCRAPTCHHCRAPAHPGTLCPEDLETERVMSLGRKEGWKQCPVCRHLISRTHGCLRMSCSQCKTGFCYSCGQQNCLGTCLREE